MWLVSLHRANAPSTIASMPSHTCRIVDTQFSFKSLHSSNQPYFPWSTLTNLRRCPLHAADADTGRRSVDWLSLPQSSHFCRAYFKFEGRGHRVTYTSSHSCHVECLCRHDRRRSAGMRSALQVLAFTRSVQYQVLGPIA
jgi:hypothetical protein